MKRLLLLLVMTTIFSSYSSITFNNESGKKEAATYQQISDYFKKLCHWEVRDRQRLFEMVDTLRAMRPSANNKLLCSEHSMIVAHFLLRCNSTSNNNNNNNRLGYHKLPTIELSREEVYKMVKGYLENAIALAESASPQELSEYRSITNQYFERHYHTYYIYTLFNAIDLIYYRYGWYNGEHDEFFEKINQKIYKECDNTYPVLHINAFIKDNKRSDNIAEIDKLIAQYSHHNDVLRLHALRINLERSEVRRNKDIEDDFNVKIVERIEELIKKYPKGDHGSLNNIIRTIKREYGHYYIHGQVYPNSRYKLELTYTNIKKAIWEIYEEGKVESDDKPIYKKSVNLNAPLGIEQKDSVEIRTPKKHGKYTLICRNESGKIISSSNFIVSSIGAIYNTNNNTAYFADLLSGKPYKRVDINTQKVNGGDIVTQRAECEGYISIFDKEEVNGGNYYIQPTFGDDIHGIKTFINVKDKAQKSGEITTISRANLYCDRYIYEPKDTIRYKMYGYEVGATNRLDSGGNYTIQFGMDDKRPLKTVDIVTDKWGGYSGYFIAPSKSMLGEYIIEVIKDDEIVGEEYILTEERATPKFEFKLTKLNKNTVYGDKITVRASAESYGDYSMEGTEVRYNIIRKAYSKGYNSIVDTIKVGAVKCDTKNSADIVFTLKERVDNERWCSYTVNATITDKLGESQSNHCYITPSEFRYYLFIDNIEPLFSKEEGKVLTIKAHHTENVVKGSYYIYNNEDSTKTLLSDKFTTDKPLNIDWNSFKSGNYTIVCRGDSISERIIDFTLISLSDKKIITDNNYIFFPINNKDYDGEAVEMLIGTKWDKMYVVIELLDKNNSVISSSVKRVNRGVHRYSFDNPTKSDVKVVISGIKDEDSFKEILSYNKIREREELKMKFISLRDKNSPGGKERFFIEVTDSSGRGVEATVVLTAYNKAANTPYSHEYRELNSQYHNYFNLYSYIGSHTSYYKNYAPMDGDYDYKNTRITTHRYSASSEMLEDVVVTGYSGANLPFGSSGQQPRSDFKKTAAFLTNITTDSNGKAEVTFNYPDALTTYKIMAVAISKNLVSTVHSDEVVVTKDVMVVTQLPKFLRGGDKVDLRIEGHNKTDKPINATLTISSKECEVIGKNKIDVLIPANSSKVVHFTVKVPNNISSANISAGLNSSTHSDTEIHNIPVIPATALHTNSKSFVVSGSKKIELADYVDIKGKNGGVTVRALSPQEMLIATLPYLSRSDSHSLLHRMANWQTEGVSRVMAYNYRDIIDGWSITSDKSQNEKVHDMINDETPWRALSANEALERIKWLSKSDATDIDDLMDNYLNEIASYQNIDGGYCWFKGMQSSKLLSIKLLDIINTLRDIKYYGNKGKDVESYIYYPTIKYLDKLCLDIHERDRESLIRTDLFIYYMYVRSQYINEIKIDDSLQSLWDKSVYYIENYKYDNNTMLPISIVSTALLRNLGKDVSRQLKSIYSYLVDNNEGGKYFANIALTRSQHYFLSSLKIHTIMLKLMRSLPERDYRLEDDVATWLMLQRKNQSWSSSQTDSGDIIATLWMHYADMMSREDSVNDVQIEISKRLGSSSGMGVFIDSDRVVKGRSSITVTGEKAFVDVIYSCQVPLESVKPQSNGFQIRRRLYKISEDKEEPINSGTALNIGDIVVARYFIESSDERNFVTLKATRTGALYPIDEMSGYVHYKGYYREVKGNQTNYFFSHIRKGVTLVEERFYVTYSGVYSDGHTSVESILSPAYRANTSSNSISIKSDLLD